MRVLRACLAVLAVSVATVVSAAASTGVSIDVGRIAVRDVLAPGGEYQLPRFGVRNPGDEATSYLMVVSNVDGQDAEQPPQDWFSFSPSSLTLDGGQSRPVSTSVEVPPDAEAGEYAALIGPQIANEGSGAQIGAGAAARLTFTVAECSGLDCWLRWALRWMGERLWLVLLPIAMLALIGLRLARRRFAFTVTRRPA
jgi:hypothetical protein